jgi:hypothetical protein
MGWLLFFVLIGIGIFFYWLRYRHRLLYGILEILVALVLLYVGIFPAETYALLIREPPRSDIVIAGVTKMVTVFGAVYVFVRGLDNIDTGLPSSTWRKRWDWVKEAARQRLNM